MVIAFEKQTKTTEDEGERQVQVLKDLKSKEQTKSIGEIFPEGYESELNKIKNIKKSQ